MPGRVDMHNSIPVSHFSCRSLPLGRPFALFVKRSRATFGASCAPCHKRCTSYGASTRGAGKGTIVGLSKAIKGAIKTFSILLLGGSALFFSELMELFSR